MYVLDVNPIDDSDVGDAEINDATDTRVDSNGSIEYIRCNITDWASLRQAFLSVGHIDIAIANAGVSEECDYFADTFDADGRLEEPVYAVLDVNYRAVLNFVKLSLSAFRRQGQAGGSRCIVQQSWQYESSPFPVSCFLFSVFRFQLSAP